METKIRKLLGKKVKHPVDLDKLFFFLHDKGLLHGPFILTEHCSTTTFFISSLHLIENFHELTTGKSWSQENTNVSTPTALSTCKILSQTVSEVILL